MAEKRVSEGFEGGTEWIYNKFDDIKAFLTQRDYFHASYWSGQAACPAARGTLDFLSAGISWTSADYQLNPKLALKIQHLINEKIEPSVDF